MSETPAGPFNTVGNHLPWAAMTLDYTEQLAEAIPADLLDWSPGGGFFTPAEALMHIIDSRRLFARQLSGDTRTNDYYSAEYAHPDSLSGDWGFRGYGTMADLLSALEDSRAELDAWLDQPAAILDQATPGTVSDFPRKLRYYQNSGLDPAGLEFRGPDTVTRVIMAVTVHEAAHRGNLQAVLRLRGVTIGPVPSP